MKHSSSPAKPDAIDLDLDSLLHPAQAFSSPRDVINDPDLTLNEKRAILASWASDACAVEAAPALRQAPGGSVAVSVDEILEALRELDREAHRGAVTWARRQFRRRSIEAFREKRRKNGGGSGRDLVH
jgi:hypothetical protein